MSPRHLLLSSLLILCLNAGASAAPKKKLLLVGHPPDGHPPATHEYDAGLRVLAKCLAPVADLEVLACVGHDRAIHKCPGAFAAA